MASNLVPDVLASPLPGYSSAVVGAVWDAVVRWWDGVELWLTQLGLALQVVLLMVVLLPACWWVARALDRIVGAIFDWLGHRYPADSAGAENSRDSR
ncbi:MAG TPA: hypothetical protein VFO16_10660 [Pseudonocardiaceae bacterium]|nr:hypothetical protein [Pseudonocardiaceae bacterium]